MAIANTINVMRTIKPWKVTLVSLLPLWLCSIAIMAEGFPRPPIPIGLAFAALLLAIGASLFLLWKGWLTFEIIYVFLPFVFMVIFDEISTRYKSPLILVCAFFLTVGIIGYQRSHSLALGWLILLLVGIATWVFANHAVNNYWDMVGDLGYVECMPDFQGCPPLTGNETPWWILFFRP